jgi:hypothetical protein
VHRKHAARLNSNVCPNRILRIHVAVDPRSTRTVLPDSDYA